MRSGNRLRRAGDEGSELLVSLLIGRSQVQTLKKQPGSNKIGFVAVVKTLVLPRLQELGISGGRGRGVRVILQSKRLIKSSIWRKDGGGKEGDFYGLQDLRRRWSVEKGS